MSDVNFVCVNCQEVVSLPERVVNQNFNRNNGHIILKDNADEDLSCPQCKIPFNYMTKTCFEIVT